MVITTREREAIRAKLQQVFDERAAGVLTEILDWVVTLRQDDGVRREDFSELKQVVAELAAAQARTEERVDRLAERMEELAAAQART
ncbi:MAG: hypothetical protein HY709_07505, partial [Candidatus Latescibacteria bacterium]|nr:hypothetical protein [Candidatus Latescibacterota bacterium]